MVNLEETGVNLNIDTLTHKASASTISHLFHTEYLGILTQ